MSKFLTFDFTIPASEFSGHHISHKNVKDLKAVCTDTGGNNITTKIENLNDDGSVDISLKTDRTGTYHLSFNLGTKKIFNEPMDIQIPAGDIVQQDVPSSIINVSPQDGAELAIKPIFNSQGLRVIVGRNDLVIKIDGGPKNNPLYSTKSSASKNTAGDIVVKFAPPLPGEYVLQVYVFDCPILNPELRFDVIDDGSVPDEVIAHIVNPKKGSQNSIPLGNIKDKHGRFLTEWATPNDLLCLMFGPEEFACEVVHRNNDLIALFTAHKEGYYKMDILNPATNELLIAKPFEIYVGTPDIKQQLINNNKPTTCTMDGFVITLHHVTNDDGELIPQYYDDDLLVEIIGFGKSQGIEAFGTAQTVDEGIKVTVIPPEPGSYRVQVFLSKRPLLARALEFSVDKK